MDSGATHHVASTSEQVDHVDSVGKPQHLLTFIGTKTPILGTGSASLPCSRSTLKLNNALLVPNATKNLLSVHKPVKDNEVAVTFTNDGCTVKDKGTGRVLMQRPPRQGLYPMNNGTQTKVPQVHVAFTSCAESDFLQWHFKLGHPSSKVLRQVLNNCNVNVIINDNFVCEAFQYGKSKLLSFP